VAGDIEVDSLMARREINDLINDNDTPHTKLQSLLTSLEKLIPCQSLPHMQDIFHHFYGDDVGSSSGLPRQPCDSHVIVRPNLDRPPNLLNVQLLTTYFKSNGLMD